MLTCCNTTRGRVACGLGGVLIAALALACLWAFSPAVTAGDDAPAKSGPKVNCPEPGLPEIPAKAKSDPLLPPTPPPPPPMPAPPKSDESAVPPLAPVGSPPPPPDLPPMTGSAKSSPLPAADSPPPPAPGPITPVSGVAPTPPPVSQAQPPADSQDIKQLVAHLSAIRAERSKLDDQERQTIQGIKKKYQEQKHALEQLDRELKQLGINCDETPPQSTDGPAPSLPPVRSR